MAYKEEVKTTYITSVICDKCQKEKLLNAGNQLSWDGKMNGAIHYGYTFEEKGNGFETICAKCQLVT
ncbi:hypothetical protein [Bacillus halotolerans]|uniref:Uncharacterized protein n=1 Tax=Bacillus halotolerans TaxID=260554 RepID=A0A9Q6A8Z8_9BACI|nr:hypothetical protein [Bacillus halotolerans]PLS07632.1 hypothetical protein CUU63_10070 [Bacillus halotolerans]